MSHPSLCQDTLLPLSDYQYELEQKLISNLDAQDNVKQFKTYCISMAFYHLGKTQDIKLTSDKERTGGRRGPRFFQCFFFSLSSTLAEMDSSMSPLLFGLEKNLGKLWSTLSQLRMWMKTAGHLFFTHRISTRANDGLLRSHAVNLPATSALVGQLHPFKSF